MTKKLINRLFYLILLVLFIKYVLPIYTTYYGVSYFSDELPEYLLFIRMATLICIIGALALFLFNTYVCYIAGNYDDFFKEKTDPYLKKICDFINRKNGGCGEKE